MEMKINRINNHPSMCYGCTLCFQICPKSAIEMKLDAKGFYYPYVNENSCVNCGLCSSICPIGQEDKFKNSRVDKCYAVKYNDEIRLQSSSGGIYSAFTNHIIQNMGGYCVGVKYGKGWQPVYSIANTFEERNEQRGSKYVQPFLDKTVADEILKLSQQGKYILISGSPCQIAAWRSLLKKKNILDDKVIFVDIVCHGVPSPKMWRDYIDGLEEKHQSKVISYTFRDKTKGWRGYHVKVEFENGLEIENTDETDTFVNLFKENLSLRDSCYNCPYSSLSRCGDITIGDFWGIENVDPIFSDNIGVSMLFINSNKGENLFRSIMTDIVCNEYSSRVVVQPNLHKPTNFGLDYKKFWKLYIKRGYSAVADRFAKGGKKYFMFYYKKALNIRLKMLRNRSL